MRRRIQHQGPIGRERVDDTRLRSLILRSEYGPVRMNKWVDIYEVKLTAGKKNWILFCVVIVVKCCSVMCEVHCSGDCPFKLRTQVGKHLKVRLHWKMKSPRVPAALFLHPNGRGAPWPSRYAAFPFHRVEAQQKQWPRGQRYLERKTRVRGPCTGTCPIQGTTLEVHLQPGECAFAVPACSWGFQSG
jgi:hypothetical protein